MPVIEYECYNCKSKFEKVEADPGNHGAENCPECDSTNTGLSIPVPTIDDPSSGFAELSGEGQVSGGGDGCSGGNGGGHRHGGGFG